MNADRLESLLRQNVMDGPRAPLSPECLDVRVILRLLEHPEQVRPEELQHLANCAYCQRAMALARRERAPLEAPWSDEVVSDHDVGPDTTAAGAAAPPRTIKLTSSPAWWRAAAAIAAVLLIAVGLGWWLASDGQPSTDGPAFELLGQLTGRFEPGSVARSGEQPPRRYAVNVDLRTTAYFTWLYLDFTRELKLPSDATSQAVQSPAGRCTFDVTIAADEPPGPQWIAAVASHRPFNPLSLRAELQAMIAAMPQDAPIQELIERLKQGLRAHPGLSFQGHTFHVPAADTP